MDKGVIVALDSPSALKAQLGGDILRLEIEGSVEMFLKEVNGLDGINRIAVEDHMVSLSVNYGESFVPKAFERWLVKLV